MVKGDEVYYAKLKVWNRIAFTDINRTLLKIRKIALKIAKD